MAEPAAAVRPSDVEVVRDIGDALGTMPVFAVVPPMSKESTRSAPMSRPTTPAAMIPAAPPDSTV